jgi:hypothetical protein
LRASVRRHRRAQGGSPMLRSIQPKRAASLVPAPTIGPSAAADIAPAPSHPRRPGRCRTPAERRPVPSDPGRPNPSRDRVTDGRTAAFTADGPGDPTGGRGEADRPGLQSDGDRGVMRATSPLFLPVIHPLPQFDRPVRAVRDQDPAVWAKGDASLGVGLLGRGEELTALLRVPDLTGACGGRQGVAGPGPATPPAVVISSAARFPTASIDTANSPARPAVRT